MAKRKFSEEQILTVLKQLEAGRTAAEMAREVGVKHIHDLFLEGKVRQHGTERSRTTAPSRRREQPLEAIGGRSEFGSGDVESPSNKKRTELVERRADAAFLIENYAATQRKACELAHIARSSFRYRANTQKDEELRAKLTQLGHEKPRYGYRRSAILLRREGQIVNHKRLFRVYRAAGLSVRRKKRKRLVRAGQPSFTATRPNQQWAIDFVQDRMANGRTLRILSIIDTFTRECLALEVDTCLPSRRVTRALDGVIAERGRPERIRMGNGSELTSRHFLAWGIDQRIELVHIQPGKPIQNAYVESFHGRLRDECLNTQWFRNLWHARRQISAWRHELTKIGRIAVLTTARPMNLLRRVLQRQPHPLHNEATTGRKRVHVSSEPTPASIDFRKRWQER